MFKHRFSTKLLGWFAGILHSQVVLSGRKLFFPSMVYIKGNVQRAPPSCTPRIYQDFIIHKLVYRGNNNNKSTITTAATTTAAATTTSLIYIFLFMLLKL